MFKQTDYKLLEETSLGALNHMVNNFLKEGYKVVGTPLIREHGGKVFYLQAVVK